MATKLQNLFNANGEIFYPVTHVKAVVNDSGENVEQLLEAQNEKIETQNKKIGDWENSNNGSILDEIGEHYAEEGDSDYDKGLWGQMKNTRGRLSVLEQKETVEKTDIINDLTTGGADKALSAEMGKELREAISFFEVDTEAESFVGAIGTNLSEYSGTDSAYIKTPAKYGDTFRVTCSSLNSTYPAAFIQTTGKSTTTILYGSDRQAFIDEIIRIERTDCSFLYVNTRNSVAQIKVERAILTSLQEKVNEEVVNKIKIITEPRINTKVEKKIGKNIFNPDDPDVIDGKYINSSGGIATYASTMVSGYIPISRGESLSINYKVPLGEGVINHALYDGDKKVIKDSIVSGSHNTITFGVDAPYNAVYARFSIPKVNASGHSISDIQIERGAVVTDYQYPNPVSGHTDELYAPISVSENAGYADIICCDGDSLTWGHLGKDTSGVDLGQSVTPYPSILQKKLGERFKVLNYGVPGAYSTTIEGNATGYEVVDDAQIPARHDSSFYVKLAFLRDREGNNVKIFGPLSSHGTLGGCNPIIIGGVKCNVLSHVDRGDSDMFQAQCKRVNDGDAVLVKSGALAVTNEAALYRGATHIIFIGANGGWKIDGTSSVHSTDNINELVNQIKDIIKMSSERYIVMSYWAWVGENSKEWEGEQIFAKEFGMHYLNLREFYSTEAIQRAIDAGYINNATTDDIQAMENGKIPPSFLNSNRSDIHLNDTGYQILGDIVYEKYTEMYKMEILGH